jgi:hypothetical protein
MIASYFGEITEVFRVLRKHLAAGATVAVDIGDSCYAGVHVPVDELLSVCLRELGYVQRDIVTLRRRKSRSGVVLRQSLLVFEFKADSTTFYIREIASPWRIQWARFKKTLPHQIEPFCKRNWGHGWHSLCSFPGKLKPAIAHNLVRTFVPEGGRLFDPFAGVGTIPFEAGLQGRLAYGLELSPAAHAVAHAKTCPPEGARCYEITANLQEFLLNASPTEDELRDVETLGFNGKINEYYEEQTLREIVLARRFFLEHPPGKPEEYFVLACLLHILHGNRPYALSRRSHPITPYKPSGPFEYRPLVDHLRTKIALSLEEELPPDFVRGKVFLHDATTWWPQEIDDLDAVITSPPFYDSTRFYSANWLRLWFAGWSSADFKGRPLGFVEERQKRDFGVYVPILRQARERLKPDGVLVFHLGKSIKCDMAAQLAQLGRRWFGSSDVFDESVVHCESHGIRDKGTVTSHQYLVLY